MNIHRASSTMLLKRTSYTKFAVFAVAAVIFVFVLAALLTALDSKYRFASSSVKEWTSSVSSETLIHFIGFENPYFTQTLPEESEFPSLSKFAFEMVTSVEPGDIRSLLGNELPGFEVYDSEIIVAGEGTNYTNLAIESAPPVEVLMAEREAAIENLKQSPQKDKPTSPPSLTTGRKNVVYIYHTHSTESYLPFLKGVTEPSESFHSKANITLVGKRLAKNLEKRGIGTKVNTTNFIKNLLNKGMEYWQAYEVSRPAVASAVSNHPNLEFFFDIHRDSRRGKHTTVTINGQPHAKVLFVVGEGHKNYEANAQMAKELHALLEKKYPGLSRGVTGKDKSEGNGVYNQDLAEHSLIIEFGGVDNTMKELSRTAEALAEVITAYYWQTQDTKKVNG